MKPRASDRLADRSSVRDPNFLESCVCVIALWQADEFLRKEFSDVIELFDFIFETADRIIEGATEK